MAFFDDGKFYWFYGVVEDRNDPEKLGRVRVRILGVHDEDKQLIPTEELPLAVNLVPSQGNFKVYPPREGQWVFGYFLDGEHAQRPAIMGIVPGVPEETVDSEVGFYDPAQNLADRPKSVDTLTLNLDGSGSTLTDTTANAFPSRLNESDTSRLARNENTENTIVQTKLDNTIEEILTAGIEVGETGEPFAEPNTTYDAVYPFNDVTETESGHVIELDDTPSAERIHIYHRAGSFQETHANGSFVQKTVNDHYRIVLRDDHQVVYGNTRLFTLGDVNVLHTNNVTEQVQANSIVVIDLNDTRKVGEDSVTIIGSNKTVNVGSNFATFTTENHGIQATQTTIAGDVHLGADSIDDSASPSSPNEEPVVLGDKLVELLDGMLKWIDGHTHATPTGPSGPGQAPPIPNAKTGHASSIVTDPSIPNVGDLQKLLSEIVKTQ